MSIEPFFFVVLLAGLIASDAAALYAQIAFCLFGATAALSLPALGGATIAPAPLFLPFFVIRAVRNRGLAWFAHSIPRAGIWLGLLALWGVISALLLPRAFAGRTQILTVDRTLSDQQVALYALHPVSGNITQPAYLVGSLLAFLAARALLVDGVRMRWLRNAVLLLGTLNICAALLNLGEFWLNLPKILSYLRSASYAVFDAYEEAGLVRIQGTFAETSSFSSFTLPLFAFAANCWLHRIRPAYSGFVAVVSLILLLASTSGTAYLGLSLYLGILCAVLATRWLSEGTSRAAPILFLLALIGIAIFYIISFEPRVVARVAEFFEFTVWNKLQSQSGLERTSWNRQAWTNFLETGGVGVGLGSARASSFPLVLLSNLGVIGLILFLGFMLQVLRPSSGASTDAPVSSAARHGALASLIAASVSGTVFDLGILFYIFAAAATASVPATQASASELYSAPRMPQMEG